ncbi:heavy metal translocating P-type ATPase, partial [Bacillus thuringiensis]|nr:heavy metal translocating P-type ATPase [Bacillus thuringiensis]
VEDVNGFGLKERIEINAYRIGRAEFISEETKSLHNGIAASLEKEGKTVVYIRDEGGILGLIALKYTVRQETIDAIRYLQSI